MSYDNQTKEQLIAELEALKLKHKRYEGVVNKIPYGLLAMQLEEDNNPESLRLIAVNEMGIESSNPSGPAEAGKLFAEVYPEWMGSDFPEWYTQVAMSGEAREPFEMPYTDPETGEFTYSAINIFPLPDRGVGIIFEDITERKQVEEELKGKLKTIQQQQQAIRELSTPIIPVMERIIVVPLVGNIDGERARNIMRALLAGIAQYRAKVVIVDVTGVPLVDSEVANHLNKTIQAARLKGSRTIITGISDAVAETIVDLGIDWSRLETLSDLQTGLISALDSMGFALSRKQMERD